MKRLYIIFAMVVGTAIVLAVALYTLEQAIPSREPRLAASMPTPTPIAQSVLSFSPSSLSLTENKQAKIDIQLETYENNVTGVQLEIAYDPDVFSDFQITPGSFLSQGDKPENLINRIDKKNGRVTYAVVLPLSQSAVTGKGIVATIALTQAPNLPPGITQSTIRILPKSLVTAEGIRKSVLAKTENATITLFTQ